MQPAANLSIFANVRADADSDADFSPFLEVPPAESAWQVSWGFALLVLTTAALFVRPSELLADLHDIPIYQMLIIGCLFVSLPRLGAELSARALRATPITVCMMALLASVVLSHLAHLNLYLMRVGGWEFFKICTLYLLILAWVDSPQRLRRFMTYLASSVLVLTTIALLQYHGVLSLDPIVVVRQSDITGSGVLLRLCGVGVFSDPNDLCMLLVVAIGASVYCLNDRRAGALRLVWLLALGIFGYAVLLTYSRGGFLALLGGMMVFVCSRFGRRNGFLLALLLFPIAFVIAGGRQTEIRVSDPTDTLQSRLQLWSEALDQFRADPLFGIGQGNMVERTGYVAHNSFLQTFTELGLLGGTALLGAFGLAIVGLSRLSRASEDELDPELRRMRPYMMSIVAGYAVGMLSLSRAYTVPTYLVVGLAAAYLRLAGATMPMLRFDRRLVTRLPIYGGAFLFVSYLFVRLFVRWD